MKPNNTAEIYNLSYGTPVFRMIDRILGLSNKEYNRNEDKLFDFSWSVRMLRALMTEDLISKRSKDSGDKFHKAEKQIQEKRDVILKLKSKGDSKYNLQDDFDNIQELFNLCINKFQEEGYMYQKVDNGDYDSDIE